MFQLGSPNSNFQPFNIGMSSPRFSFDAQMGINSQGDFALGGLNWMFGPRPSYGGFARNYGQGATMGAFGCFPPGACSPMGTMIQRNYGHGGIFGWRAVQGAAQGVGRLVSGGYYGSDPYAQAAWTSNYIEADQAAYEDYKAARGLSGSGAAGDGDTGTGDVPEDITQRAKDYFEQVITNDNDPEKEMLPYSKESKAAWKKALSKDVDLRRREQSLKDLVGYIHSWVKEGENKEENYSRFIAQVEEWGDDITTEQKLLAVLSPGAADGDDMGDVWQKIFQKLGDYNPEQKPGDVFKKFVRQLKDRLGADYERVINTLFQRTLAHVKAQSPEALKPVTTADVTEKGYTAEEAAEIIKAMEGMSAIKQHRILEKITDAEESDSPEMRALRIGSWYLKNIKIVKKDDDEIQKEVRKVYKAAGKDLGKMMARLRGETPDGATTAGSSGPSLTPVQRALKRKISQNMSGALRRYQNHKVFRYKFNAVTKKLVVTISSSKITDYIAFMKGADPSFSKDVATIEAEIKAHIQQLVSGDGVTVEFK